ncbi:Nck-associated protein 1 [Artemisia annua]|uniref:Nck-associated protein 1 n=1 Tax=Artemisia annua TaxID=35608 RepID=A0A2U1KT30_ARTAN|nr:Nck-associated protein 1 [Artemisia annua]
MQMPKSRLNLSTQEALSTSPRAREVEGPSRWSEYLSQELATPMTSRTSRNNGSEVSFQLPGVSHKGLNMQWVYQLTQVAQGLMAKIYRLNQILDYPDSVGHAYSEAFWKAGVFPNCPKICILLSKKFPEHHSKLQLERVDKVALDALNDQAEVHLQSLEPWIQVWSLLY